MVDRKKGKGGIKADLSQAANSLLALFNNTQDESLSSSNQNLTSLSQENSTLNTSPPAIPLSPIHPSNLLSPQSFSSVKSSNRHGPSRHSDYSFQDRRPSIIDAATLNIPLTSSTIHLLPTSAIPTASSRFSNATDSISIGVTSPSGEDQQDTFDDDGFHDKQEQKRNYPAIPSVESPHLRTNLSLYEEDGTNRDATASYLSSHSWDPRRAIELASPLSNQEAGKSISKLDTNNMGTMRGVFIPCIQTILGVIMFTRLPWIIGEAGVGLTLVIIAMSVLCTFLTTTSMSAIATNGFVPAGGPYYMISRSLGKEIGVSVGILFYLTTTIGTALYILGAVEILVVDMAPSLMFGSSANHGRVYGTALLICLIFICFGGLRYINQFSIVFLIFVFIALMSIFIGLFWSYRPSVPLDAVIGFPGNLTNNFDPGFNKVDLDGNINPENIDFYSLFAIFFPSVTGILAGSQRSALLKNPSKSIPVGTIAAIGFSTLIYVAFVFLFGAVCTGEFLRTQTPSYGLHVAVIAWPTQLVALIGCFLSCLGAALQTLATAPRLIQAVAKDDIIPWLSFFRVAKNGEPQRAILLTYLLVQGVVLIGKIDMVAPITTMLFLVFYASLNSATALLSILQYPNWRPSWKFYHWSLSLFGAVLCIVYMFLIGWIFALVTLVLVVAFYKYIEYRGAKVTWGDGLLAVNLSVAQKNLLSLERHRNVHAKNWRPQIMMFLELDQQDYLPKNPYILYFLSQLRKSGGLSIVASVIEGELLEKVASKEIEEVRENLYLLMRQYSINGFVQVLAHQNSYEAKILAIQSVGIGVLKPNTILLSYPNLRKMKTRERDSFVHLLRVMVSMEYVIMLFKADDPEFIYPANNSRPLSSNDTIDVYWIMHDGGILTLLPYILRKHRIWRKAKMRVFCIAQEHDNSLQMKKDLEVLLSKFRIDADALIVELGNHDISEFTYEKTLRMQQRAEMLSEMNIASQSEIIVTAPVLPTLDRKRPDKKKVEYMNTSVKLNNIFKIHSEEASLIFCNLPSPSPGQNSTDYLEYIDTLVDGLPRVCLVKGTGMEVVTTYF